MNPYGRREMMNNRKQEVTIPAESLILYEVMNR
jgi:hypothetical protein